MKYLVDEKFPDYLKTWSSENFLHVTKIRKSISDKEMWEFAIDKDLIVLTMDSILMELKNRFNLLNWL